ncbi:helix-turn-helix domain-containing protein [Streptomyces mirabilis]
MPDSPSGRPAARQTITRVLRKARGRIDPRDIPGFAAACGTKEGAGLTQNEVARLLGVTPKWYRNLELGKPLTYSKGFLESVRRVLMLTDDEWETVWHLTQWRPAPDSDPEQPVRAAGNGFPAAVRQFIDAQSWATYVCDRRWDLLHYNAAALRDYPWILHGTNVMSWVLTYPEARTQLINWESDWAIPMIAQLRYHAELWKDDLGLQALVQTVHSDPSARSLWDSPHLPTLPHPSTAVTRRLYLPRQGLTEFDVTLLTIKIVDTPFRQLTIVIPSAAAGEGAEI